MGKANYFVMIQECKYNYELLSSFYVNVRYLAEFILNDNLILNIITICNSCMDTEMMDACHL